MTSARLTPMATLVLGLLREEPLHPYEMLSRLTKRHDDRHVRLSPGAVYHAVDKLLGAGLVVEVGSERRGKRPERTTYAITPEGCAAQEQRTRELLVDRPHEYAAFPVGLDLIHHLSPDDALDCLRRRRDDLAAEAAYWRSTLTEIVATGLPRRFVLDAYFAIHQAEAEVDWLTTTIDEIATGDLSWTDLPSAHFRAAFAAATDKENPR